jgi:hypothetical protein
MGVHTASRGKQPVIYLRRVRTIVTDREVLASREHGSRVYAVENQGVRG